MAVESAIALRIRTALGDYLKRDPNTIRPDHHLRDDLGLDSMATIELLYQIEEAFDLQIPDQDLQKLLAVADVIGYVEGRLKPSSPARATGRTAKRLPARKKG
ncbi:MAG: acyl carrier protein [Nitrospiraceae bacterium]